LLLDEIVAGMKSVPINSSKAPTGITGLDEITRGGLARGRATLLSGGAGAGKSVLALQILVNGAFLYDEAGIFVAFEESSERIKANAAGFGWNLDALEKRKLFFLNAQPTAALIQSGSFDLDGLLTMLACKVRDMGAKRVVFDAVDIVLSLLDDQKAERQEIYKLHEWFLAQGVTAIITAKQGQDHLSLMEFMVDCAVKLNHKMIQGISQRNLRVQKYRGSAFEENESPFVIGEKGIEVAGSRQSGKSLASVSNERVSTGVPRLDAMLDGGYYRSSSVLITGLPGTAKTTLAGAFAAAACKRGERCLFVTFDSDANEVTRNLSSVNIRLQRFIKSGMLRTESARMIGGNAEIHLMRIKNLAKEHRSRCLVIDPVSALSKTGNQGTVHSVAERLIEWAKSSGITLLCTSLLEGSAIDQENTPLQISTIADTWIHLNYLVKAGERNRGLSIIKSRGTAHSNQVREMILSDRGITLADAYLAGGEVLMGAMRSEKESAARLARLEAARAAQRQRLELEGEEARLTNQIKSLQRELDVKRAEMNLSGQVEVVLAKEFSHGKNSLMTLRKADFEKRNEK
jgi:circadian clock protein KaiC